jgi:hypothetical protein
MFIPTRDHRSVKKSFPGKALEPIYGLWLSAASLMSDIGAQSLEVEIGYSQRLLIIANMSSSTRARRLLCASDMGQGRVGV